MRPWHRLLLAAVIGASCSSGVGSAPTATAVPRVTDLPTHGGYLPSAPTSTLAPPSPPDTATPRSTPAPPAPAFLTLALSPATPTSTRTRAPSPTPALGATAASGYCTGGDINLGIPNLNWERGAPEEGWCAEASIQMALRHYGLRVSQAVINRSGTHVGHPDLWNDGILTALPALGARDIVLPSSSSVSVAAFMTWVTNELELRHPVIVGVKYYPDENPDWDVDHYVLVVGCDSTGLLINTNLPEDGQVHASYEQLASKEDGTFSFVNRFKTFFGVSVTGVAPVVIPTVGSALAGTNVPVTASWRETNTGTGIAKYTLELRTNSGTWDSQALSPLTARTFATSLTAGSDSYTFRVSTTDGTGNVSSPVAGPTFKVSLTPETSSSVKWSGTWTSQSRSTATGGTLRYATKAGASATFTFTGRAVAWVAPRGTRAGKAKVYVDGVYAATVDLRTSATESQRVVFARAWTTSKTRRIRIVCQAASGRPRIDVDAFVVMK